MKKLVALLLTAAIGVSMLAGCGTSKGTSSDSVEAEKSEKAAETSKTADVDYPTKAIEVVCGFGAGGDTDLFARALCEKMTEDLGVSVMVTNMEGGGGSSASNYVKDSANDGYTVFWCHNTLLVNNLTNVTDYTHDAFETASLCAHNAAYTLCLDPNKYSSIEDFIDYAKANPGETSIGVVYGGAIHTLALALCDTAGIDVNIVDIGSSSNGNVELLAGRIDAVPVAYASCKSYLESGEMLAGAIFGEDRVDQLDGVPTFKELGYDVSGDFYYGFYFPAGTDQAVIDIFNEAAKKAVEDESFSELCATYAAEPVFIEGDEAVETMNGIMDMYSRYKDLLNQ